MLPLIRRLIVLTLLVIYGLSLRAGAQEAKTGPAEFKELKYRSIGPSAGGRTCRSCGIPGNPLIYYTATASGGVWKTTDGGVKWKPIFDEQGVASCGSIALAPSDPNVVYVGTGEANIRGNVAAGNGIYKSIDGGKSWKHVWKQEGQIGTMIVHPTNADVAYAAVLGKAFGPNPERGVYRTTDGGKSWQQVLKKDADTGASDVCFDPSNPKILFAGLWQARRKPWEMTSGGPGSGLYVSRDGGDTWKQLGGAGVATDDLHGLPEGIYGKVCVAVAPSDGRRVYAMIENEKGGLYRSDDGGESWKRITTNKLIRQRPWYFSSITVDPSNADVVWCPSVPLLKSIDGGKTFARVKGTHHVDHHDIWIDPKDPKRIIDSNDGGVDISVSGGESWFVPRLPLCQFYHIATDSSVPYRIMGTMQDLGSASGPSNSLSNEGIPLSAWHQVGGGEAGHAVPDPSDPDIVYAGEYGGYISRYDHRTRQGRNVTIYPANASGHGGEDLRYRFQWTSPILVSNHDPKSVYHAANVIFQTTDAGKTWKPVSPDLTRNDKTKQKWSGGPITGDNTGVEIYGTVFALAESPRTKGVLWAGSDDGLIHVSRDGGKEWSNVTKNIPGLPEWGTVSCIEPSRFEDGAAYVVLDAHRLDNTRPYLFKTTDFGKTWKSLTGNLPQDVYLHVVREDPKKQGLLFLGSERGVAFSRDEGGSWEQLKLNLPTVAVHDLVVKDNDLVVGTHGRSVWIFDNLTPLREWTPKIADQDVHLFTVPPAVRWRYSYAIYGTTDKNAGDNPPRGALIDYFLKKKPKDPVTLEIMDAKGAVVRKLSSKEEPVDTDDDDEAAEEEQTEEGEGKRLPIKPGVNRFNWDLRAQGAEKIKKAKADSGDPTVGPLVLPGTYTLKLTVDGKTVTTTVRVDPDPRVELTAAELEEQMKAILAVRDDITKLTQTVEQLRSIRQQLNRRNVLLKGDAKAETLIKQSKALVEKLDALEAKLHNPKAEIVYDILAQKGGSQLYSKLISLYEWLHDSDGPVTQGMRESYAEEAEALKKGEAEFRALLSDDLVKLNELAQKLEVPGVIVPGNK